MRLRLEAEPEELEKRGLDLLELFAERIGIDLTKALPAREHELKYPILRTLLERSTRIYREHVSKMEREILGVLEATLRKGGDHEDADLFADSPGSRSVSQRQAGVGSRGGFIRTQFDGDGDREYQFDEHDSFDGEIVRKADPTKFIADEDEVAYEATKVAFFNLGFSPSDFEEGGHLYGHSTNQLLEILDGMAIEKAHSHKYTKRTWMQDHWVYEYAKKHGGSVVGHHEDLGKVVVRLPKSKHGELVQFAAAHGLGAPKQGETYSVVFLDEATAKKIAKPGAQPVESKPLHPSKKSGGIPPYAGVPWVAHETLEEAHAWVKQLNIHAQYPDLPTANAVNEALSRSASAVLKHVRFIGTAAQLPELAKIDPEFAKLAASGKHQFHLGMYKLSGGAAAIAEPVGGKPYRRSFIVIREDYFDHANAEKLKAMSAPGFSVSTGLRELVIHELGHVEGFVMRSLDHPEGGKVWDRYKALAVQKLKTDSKSIASDISKYATTNPHELWAELAVLRRGHGKPIPEWAQKIVDDIGIDKMSWPEKV